MLPKLSIEMVKIMVSLVQLKFLGSFVIWFSWRLRRWIILLVSFSYQLLSGFCSSLCVFNVWIRCNLFHRLFDKNFDQWILWILDICSVLNFWEFKIEVYVEVDAIVVSIRILRCICWTGLLRWFEDVSCSVVLPLRFSWGSGLLEYWIRLYVRGRWFGCSLRLGMPLNSPARRPSSSSLVTDERQRSCSRTNVWHPSTYPQRRISCLFTQLVLKLVVCVMIS